MTIYSENVNHNYGAYYENDDYYDDDDWWFKIVMMMMMMTHKVLVQRSVLVGPALIIITIITEMTLIINVTTMGKLDYKTLFFIITSHT